MGRRFRPVAVRDYVCRDLLRDGARRHAPFARGLAVIRLRSGRRAGDAVNYAVGAILGPRVFHYENSRILNKKYLMRTHEFYEKYGGKTIVLARFVPIVRTFAPFIAGIGKMGYGRFWVFNCLGGAAWVTIFLMGGYYFGNFEVI